jgi:hypothetical protein
MSSLIGKIGSFFRPRLPAITAAEAHPAIDATSALTPVAPVRPQLPRPLRDRMRRASENVMRAIINQSAAEWQQSRRASHSSKQSSQTDVDEDDHRLDNLSRPPSGDEPTPIGQIIQRSTLAKPQIRTYARQQMLRLIARGKNRSSRGLQSHQDLEHHNLPDADHGNPIHKASTPGFPGFREGPVGEPSEAPASAPALPNLRSPGYERSAFFQSWMLTSR